MGSRDNIIKIIETSLAEFTLDKLDLFLLSNSDDSEALNENTVNHLLKILQRDGKTEYKVLHVNCVLSCLQHFLKTDVNSKKWEQIAENISKLCEGTYVVSDSYIKTDSLTQKVVNAISDLVEHSSSLADHMLNYMTQSLLKTASSVSCSQLTRLQVLGLLSTLLLKSSRQARTQTLTSPTVLNYLVKLSNCLTVCGDYETQLGVVEVLARSYIFIKETEQASRLFKGCPKILQAFNLYKFINFDPECRLFLNEVNKELGDKRLVFSVPCMIVIADNIRLKKPIDLLYKEFWVDWNLGSRTLSLYHMVSECWEVMVVAEDSVEEATARNSSCKGKNGDVIAAIKMEITMKTSNEYSKLPKMLKMYCHKTKEFAKVEEIVIREILGDKYKSDVAYSDEPQPCCLVTPVPKQNETWTNHSEINKMIPDQVTTGNDSESPDVVGPSPAVPGHIGSNTGRNIRGTHQFGKRDFVRSTMHTTQLMEEQKILDDCKDKVDMHKTLPSELELSVDDKIRETLEKHISPKTKDTEIEHQKDLDMLNVTLNSKASQSTITADLSNIMNKSINKNCSSHSLNEEHYSSPEQLLPDKMVTNRKELAVRSVGINGKKYKQNDDCSDLCNNRSALKKRRLYSMENNNTKDLVLSSQEDFSAEMPDYKLKKPEQKKIPVRKRDRKNISYSYISNKEKASKTNNVIFGTEESIIEPNQQSSNPEKPAEDMKRNHPQSIKNPPCTLKYYTNLDRKLLDLNKTSSSSKTSNIFPSNSEYSMPSSDRCCQKTYSRPKQKKRVRVFQLADSDSDPEYMPSAKKPVKFEARQKANRCRGKTYVNQLSQKEDLILDLELPNEMELEPLQLDEPKMIPKHIELPSPITKGSNARKNNPVGNKKKSTTKQKSNKEEKIVPTNRYTRGKKNTKPVKEATEVPVTTDIVNYETALANYTADNDDMAMGMLNRSFAQGNATNSEISEMAQFAEFCIHDVKRINDNITSLAQQQREIRDEAYSLKATAFFNAMAFQQRSMEALANNLLGIKTMVDCAYNMQSEISAQIQTELTQFQEARQELKEKNDEIEKIQISKTRNLFQGLSRHISNLFSFFRGGLGQKALPE